MEHIYALLSNKVLLAAVSAWFLAQFMKFIAVLATENRVDFRRLLFGAGGTPSSHSSSVCAMTTCVGRMMGLDSAMFAVCFILSIIVMYDASGVRRAAGQHAAVLNKLIDSWARGTEDFDNIELKELLGHTPLQVFLGAVLGVAVGLLFKL